MSDIQEMIISIATDGDDSELDMLRINLLEELSILPVNAIEPVNSGEAPANTRGFDAIGLGKLMVKSGPNVSRRVANAVHSWLQRSSASSVDLTIDGDSVTLSNPPTAEQEKALGQFITKHQSS
ncbi:MAG TPA: hypothetical protein VMA73_15170 [Streptosporangiaceae bacterium]|nr:hypothetical protein [Streptosporangiaceae bacterium]